MEEVFTRKRTGTRRNFAFLDDVDAQIAESMGKMLRRDGERMNDDDMMI